MAVVRRMSALSACLALTTVLGLTAVGEARALSMVDCAALSAPVYQAINPNTQASLLTRWADEAQAAARYGYSEYRGEVFRASRYQTGGMVAVQRLSRNGDFAYEADPRRIADLKYRGYADHGLAFYAAGSADWCTAAVRVAQKDNVHRYPAGDAAAQKLEQAGWSTGSVVFHVAAPPVDASAPTSVEKGTITDAGAGDTKFSFAVIPDTQPEVWRAGDPRFANRSQWLVANKSKYDIRWAIHTGDLVDWDDATHSHYENAKVGLAPLKGKLPFFLNIGNHDSAATCYGGSACDGRFVPQMARMTRTFNQYFQADDFGAPVGAFEPGKVDNTYARFKAGNRWWMILNLELWPRKEVVEWARALVARHSKHNVIVATHSFMSPTGTIGTSAHYGSTSPRYLWDTIIKRYQNVKIVLSGHTGSQRTSVLTGSAGNKIYSFLTTYHSKTSNPVRLIEIDNSRKTIRTWVEALHTKSRLLSPLTYSGLRLV